jgi:xanthosine utilization system XapX-like protein
MIQLPELPEHGGKYLRYILAFGVTFVVGLAPFLGKVDVPLFTAILDVFPLNVSESLIPFAAFIMTFPAVAVQFFGEDVIPSENLNRWFLWTFAFIAPLTIALYFYYSFTVTLVNFEGQKGMAAYVYGTHMLPDCPCATHQPPLRITSCIGNAISLNPAEVTDCYPADEINPRKAILSALYMVLMLGFGTLIGLLVLKEQQRRLLRQNAPGPG